MRFKQQCNCKLMHFKSLKIILEITYKKPRYDNLNMKRWQPLRIKKKKREKFEV